MAKAFRMNTWCAALLGLLRLFLGFVPDYFISMMQGEVSAHPSDLTPSIRSSTS